MTIGNSIGNYLCFNTTRIDSVNTTLYDCFPRQTEMSGMDYFCCQQQTMATQPSSSTTDLSSTFNTLIAIGTGIVVTTATLISLHYHRTGSGLAKWAATHRGFIDKISVIAPTISLTAVIISPVKLLCDTLLAPFTPTQMLATYGVFAFLPSVYWIWLTRNDSADQKKERVHSFEQACLSRDFAPLRDVQLKSPRAHKILVGTGETAYRVWKTWRLVFSFRIVHDAILLFYLPSYLLPLRLVYAIVFGWQLGTPAPRQNTPNGTDSRVASSSILPLDSPATTTIEAAAEDLALLPPPASFRRPLPSSSSSSAHDKDD